MGENVYKYIYADPKVVKKLSGIGLWLPSAIVKLPECRPKESFLFDCFLSTIARNPYLRVLLIKKLPKKIKVVESPSIEAPKLEFGKCTERDIINDLIEIKKELSLGNVSKIDELIDKLSKPQDIEIRTRLFFRRRRYVITAEKLKKISKDVAYESVKLVLKGLCINVDELHSYSMPRIEVEPVYTYLVIDIEKAFAAIIIGKHIEVSNSHYSAIVGIESIAHSIIGEELSK